MTTLELSGRSARFVSADGAREVVAPLGSDWLLEKWLLHAPPTAGELEAAIEAVEDLVMPVHGQLPREETLSVHGDAAGLRELAGMSGPALSLPELEELFNRAAAVASGRPAASEPVLARADVMASLLILRETMHHLGFARLEWTQR